MNHVTTSAIASALLASSLTAADVDFSVTPRISLGLASGIGITGSEFQSAVDDLASVTGKSASGEYSTMAGVNFEIPVIVGIGKKESKVYFSCGPALVVSNNKNDFTMTSGVIKWEGTDKFSARGAKLYAGIGIHGGNSLTLEVMPYLGFAHVTETLDGKVVNTTTGVSVSSTGDESGSMTLYGGTVGVYYSPNTTSGFQFGGRVGYVGASGKIDDTNCEQSGLMFAVEVGFRI